MSYTVLFVGHFVVLIFHVLFYYYYYYFFFFLVASLGVCSMYKLLWENKYTYIEWFNVWLHATLCSQEGIGPTPKQLGPLTMWLTCILPLQENSEEPQILVRWKYQGGSGALIVALIRVVLCRGPLIGVRCFFQHSRGLLLTDCAVSSSAIPEQLPYEQVSHTYKLDD